MRSTTGKFKNKKLYFPRGIRPTQDKVRKAVFDILGDISGLSFLDLFAGSGAVGFEALSRGAGELVLVELNRDSVDAIRKNIGILRDAPCSVIHIEAQKAVKLLHERGKTFNIIFLDPPYCKFKAPRYDAFNNIVDSPGSGEEISESLAKKILQTLEAYDILSPNGLVVVQRFKNEELPQAMPGLLLVKEAKYGDTRLSIFQKKE